MCKIWEWQADMNIILRMITRGHGYDNIHCVPVHSFPHMYVLPYTYTACISIHEKRDHSEIFTHRSFLTNLHFPSVPDCDMAQYPSSWHHARNYLHCENHACLHVVVFLLWCGTFQSYAIFRRLSFPLVSINVSHNSVQNDGVTARKPSIKQYMGIFKGYINPVGYGIYIT